MGLWGLLLSALPTSTRLPAGPRRIMYGSHISLFVKKLCVVPVVCHGAVVNLQVAERQAYCDAVQAGLEDMQANFKDCWSEVHILGVQFYVGVGGYWLARKLHTLYVLSWACLSISYAWVGFPLAACLKLLHKPARSP